MGVWYRFPLRWGSKFYFPSNPFCQTLSHHSSIQYRVYFLLHFTFETLYFNAHHGLRSHCRTNLPVGSFHPSSILTNPTPPSCTQHCFYCDLTRVNPYIRPAAQPPLTFLTPRCASLQSEALQIEPAWGQVAGRTQLKSGLVDLCGSQLLLALLSFVPSICPLSNSNPGASASEIILHLSHHDPLTWSDTSEASVVCLDENLDKIRSSFPYLPTGTISNWRCTTSCDDLTDIGWKLHIRGSGLEPQSPHFCWLLSSAPLNAPIECQYSFSAS